MDTRKLKINIRLDGRNYPLTINAKDEEKYRQAAKKVNELARKFRGQFAEQDTKDILAIHKQNPNGREPGNITQARFFENKMIVVYKHLPMLYVISHFIFWSGYFLYKSKFAISLYFKSVFSMFKRMKVAKREVINSNGMQYLRKVKARLLY